MGTQRGLAEVDVAASAVEDDILDAATDEVGAGEARIAGERDGRVRPERRGEEELWRLALAVVLAQEDDVVLWRRVQSQLDATLGRVCGNRRS